MILRKKQLFFIISTLRVLELHFIVGQVPDQLLQLGLRNYLEKLVRPSNPKNNAVYDFIIVGAGAAGCTLANRLSENPKWSILLIEAGGVENIFHQTPIMSAYLQSTHSNWGYKSTPQKKACFGMYKNECSLPRGKILGGTSSINFMIYNRGNRRDYDRWSEFGNTGWSYEEVLPYFLKSENAVLPGLENSPYHNQTGPLSVNYVGFRSKLVDAFIEGAQQSGHKSTDYNGESQIGVSYVQANTLGGRRHSAFKAFIEPIRAKRKNLEIITFAKATKVLIDAASKTAYGLKFLYNRRSYQVKALKEVIVSAGTFNSPQVLMLSGIGPADNLKAIGVPIQKELPVGKRLYDHMSHFGPVFLTNTSGETLFLSKINVGDLKSFLVNGNSRTRLSSIGGVEALTFIKVPHSKEPADFPDVELIFVDGSLASDGGTALKIGANLRNEVYEALYGELQRKKQDHFTILVMQFHPKSHGRLWLKDRNPLHWPIINPNYFADEGDVEDLLAGIKESIRISESPALQKIGARLSKKIVPGCEGYQFASDDYWRCSIRVLSYTLHHQVATCRMGPESDPSTVVDSQLRVHGIRKLRVADTSIIPFPPTCHTNAPAIMIGEKAADMIKDSWKDS